MAVKKTKAETVEKTIEIMELRVGVVKCHIVGTSPMIMHRFAAKAITELLFPKGKKNTAEKATSLKHDPIAEFRDTIYRNRDDKQPSLVHVPFGAFQQAMSNAALDIPGAKKSEIMRLCKVITPQINLFGVPKLRADMVRNSDINKTPDIRFRACFPRWACSFDVQFVQSLIKEGHIGNLLAAAGLIIGIGDWRSQKGGVSGSFRICQSDDAEYRDIVKNEGRRPQQAAFNSPEAFDEDSEEILRWFYAEAIKRERAVPTSDSYYQTRERPKPQKRETGAAVASAATRANGKKRPQATAQ